jgi:hypothetical protein
MAAGATYEPIATFTLSSTQFQVDFNSIPQTYTDLIMINTGNTLAGPTDNALRFNNDGSTTCYLVGVLGDGSGVNSYLTSATYVPMNGLWTSNGAGIQTVHINNYSNTTQYKSVLTRVSNGTQSSSQAAMWPQTSAITSLSVWAGGSNYVAGSTFTLYGIAAA